MKIGLLFPCFLCLFAFLSGPSLFAQSAERPNVILMMTDDQGWGGVEYSQELSPNPTNPADRTFPGEPTLKTPELADMAQAGLKCNRFYAAAAVCSPTRASFLTGRSHRRCEIEFANDSHLYNRELTIAEVAASIGYRTGHFGKWHLGSMDKSIHPIDSNRGGTTRVASALDFSTPWNNAYDSTFATESKTFTFNPTSLSPVTHYWTGFEQYLELDDPSVAGDDSKVMMDRVIPFIQNSVASGEPFVATVWFHTPHKPYTNLDVATLQEFYTNAELNAMNTNELGYYGALTAMDKQVGRLRDELRALGIENDTLVLFTSDNGPEDGVPGVAANSFTTGFASGNLRGRKRDFYEGGIRVPTIFEWPGRIAANSSTHAVSGVIDLFPTLLELWGLQLPDDRPLDGDSILGILDGTATQRVNSMKFDYNFDRQRAIIAADGRYKAVSNTLNAPWELYDLIADPKETTNLAAANPAKLNELTTQWQAWRDGVDTHIATQVDYEDYISSYSGVNIEVDEPSDFSIGANLSPTPELIVERQMATLKTDLALSSDGSPGTYNTGNQPPGATVPADTVVDSFLIHFDASSTAPASPNADLNSAVGTVNSFNGTHAFAYDPVADSVNFQGNASGLGGGEWIRSGLTRGFRYDANGGAQGTGDGAMVQNNSTTFNQNPRAVLYVEDDNKRTTGPRQLAFDTFADDNSAANSLGFIVELYAWNDGQTAPQLSVGGPVPNNPNYNVTILGDATSLLNVQIPAASLANATWQTTSLGTIDVGTGFDNYMWRVGIIGATVGDFFAFDNFQFVANNGAVSGMGAEATVDITFDHEILGVIGSRALLAASDDLAFANPTFSNNASRGFDFSDPTATDQWSISADGRTISIEMQVDSNTLDELRILTAAASIEIPNKFALGDIDRNGEINFFDISPFIALLSGGGFQFEADINGDGFVTFLDIAGFVAALAG